MRHDVPLNPSRVNFLRFKVLAAESCPIAKSCAMLQQRLIFMQNLAIGGLGSLNTEFSIS